MAKKNYKLKPLSRHYRNMIGNRLKTQSANSLAKELGIAVSTLRQLREAHPTSEYIRLRVKEALRTKDLEPSELAKRFLTYHDGKTDVQIAADAKISLSSLRNIKKGRTLGARLEKMMEASMTEVKPTHISETTITVERTPLRSVTEQLTPKLPTGKLKFLTRIEKLEAENKILKDAFDALNKATRQNHNLITQLIADLGGN